jgi:hypothetical protein
MSAVPGQSEGYLRFWLRRVYNPTCQIHVDLVDFVVFGARLAPGTIRSQKGIGDSNATGCAQTGIRKKASTQSLLNPAES